MGLWSRAYMKMLKQIPTEQTNLIYLHVLQFLKVFLFMICV